MTQKDPLKMWVVRLANCSVLLYNFCSSSLWKYGKVWRQFHTLPFYCNAARSLETQHNIVTTWESNPETKITSKYAMIQNESKFLKLQMRQGLYTLCLLLVFFSNETLTLL